MDIEKLKAKANELIELLEEFENTDKRSLNELYINIFSCIDDLKDEVVR